MIFGYIYDLHIEFHIPNSVSSLVTTVMLKVKEYFCIAAMLLLHILQSIRFGRNCIILKDLLSYIVSTS